MKLLTAFDIDAITTGVAVLGSGGGGDPSLEHLIVQDLLRAGKTVSLITATELPEDACIFSVGFVGAPLVSIEKIPTMQQVEMLVCAMRSHAQGRPIVLMPVEIGGGNGMVPLIIGGMFDMPVLDADFMGRAFPEIPMVTPTLYGIEPSPFFIAGIDSVITISHASGKRVEEIARAICVSLGSSMIIATYCMDSTTVKNVAVLNTMSKALAIGSAVADARIKAADPIKTLCSVAEGVEYGRGMITDIEHTLDGGFLTGQVTLSGEKSMRIIFKNEYLIAYIDNQIAITTPDIIALLDTETGKAITTEGLTLGLRCALVAFKGADIWKTEAGFNLVGPAAFGLTV